MVETNINPHPLLALLPAAVAADAPAVPRRRPPAAPAAAAAPAPGPAGPAGPAGAAPSWESRGVARGDVLSLQKPQKKGH